MKIGKILLIMFVSFPSFAKDLGSYGQLFPIQEPDMMDLIQSRLNHMQNDGEMNEIQKKAEDNVKKHAVRPPSVPGISKASSDRTWLYDPTFTANKDITDGRGNYIVHAGQSINPLDKIPFNETLFFIDGDNQNELDWVKSKIKFVINFKVILVNGNIPKTSDYLKEQIYFDQYGVMTSKFGIEHTPAEVYQERNKLRVKEIKVP